MPARDTVGTDSHQDTASAAVADDRADDRHARSAAPARSRVATGLASPESVISADLAALFAREVAKLRVLRQLTDDR